MPRNVGVKRSSLTKLAATVLSISRSLVQEGQISDAKLVVADPTGLQDRFALQTTSPILLRNLVEALELDQRARSHNPGKSADDK